METAELQDKIFAYMQKMKGKKKLKEKDVIRALSEETGEEKDSVKKALRLMIDVGKLMYSYGGGASSVEIPSDEYLKEKGLRYWPLGLFSGACGSLFGRSIKIVCCLCLDYDIN